MLVYGNIIKGGATVQDSIYRGMSAMFVHGLRSVHDLGDTVYFESDVNATHRQLKGLAIMSTLQLIAPYSEIKRPNSKDTRMTPDEVKAIIAICANPLSSTVQS
uniref:Thioredoxin n=1 Tax=Acinetobacter phage AJO2 TaxID=2315465 RepID=A0A3B8DM39_9CAUD|nr:thioredoxin [Acinetobacter phage AJO2]